MPTPPEKLQRKHNPDFIKFGFVSGRGVCVNAIQRSTEAFKANTASTNQTSEAGWKTGWFFFSRYKKKWASDTEMM